VIVIDRQVLWQVTGNLFSLPTKICQLLANGSTVRFRLARCLGSPDGRKYYNLRTFGQRLTLGQNNDALFNRSRNSHFQFSARDALKSAAWF